MQQTQAALSLQNYPSIMIYVFFSSTVFKTILPWNQGDKKIIVELKKQLQHQMEHLSNFVCSHLTFFHSWIFNRLRDTTEVMCCAFSQRA